MTFATSRSRPVKTLRPMGERRRVDRDDLADDHAAPAFGALGEEVDPSFGDAVSGGVVGQSRGQRDTIAQGAPADFQRAEQAREIRIAAHHRVFLRPMARTAQSRRSGDEQHNAGRNEADRPDEIAIDPGVPQDGEPDPLIDRNRDGGCGL